MPVQTNLMEQLNLTHPIIQAPMAGGATTVELVAAACEAGALGFFGAAYLTPDKITRTAQALRKRTAKPFGINIFAPLPSPEKSRNPTAALERLAPFHKSIKPAATRTAVARPSRFNEQLAAVLESGASVFSFTFGHSAHRSSASH